MLNVFKTLAQDLSEGRPAVLAGIVRQDGSSPRSLGTRFLVRHDGSLEGTIGGGTLEAGVITRAKSLLGREASQLVEIRMTGKEVAETDMICGGNVDVLVQSFLPGNDPLLQVIQEIIRLLEKGGRGVLVTGPLPTPGEDARVHMSIYLPERGMVGSLDGPAVKEWMISRADGILAANKADHVRLPETPGEFILEPLQSRPTVIIFGGGHISVKLCPLTALVGFRVVVVDDREEFVATERFPEAESTLVCDYEECFQQLDFTPETYSVIVTRGHLHDKTVLAGVLDEFRQGRGRYVGMIGSRRKRDLIYDALMEEGFSPELIKKVHSPIGLGIGAESPEEIAVSIVAELIRERAENLRLVKNWKV